MSVGGGERIMLVHIPVLEKPVLHPHPSGPVAASQPHVAIICDGNGRWATSRAPPRSAGHRAGAEAARRVIRCAPHLGIHTLTLFALSSANWARPAAEVAAILQILQEYLAAEPSHCLAEGIRLTIIGRRDRLPANLREAIADSEAPTANGGKLHLRRLAGKRAPRPNMVGPKNTPLNSHHQINSPALIFLEKKKM